MKMWSKAICVLLLICVFVCAKTKAVTVSGYVADVKSGEALIGVSVFCKEQNKGTSTNAYGFYSIEVNGGCMLQFSYLGYELKTVSVVLTVDTKLDVTLTEARKQLKEVVVTTKAEEEQLHANSTGTLHLNMKQAGNIPMLGGERDIIKVMQLMPGVKRGGDGNTGMYVRGGSADQNLILMDEAPVYNASHLLGFFSVFNSDAIKDVSMVKGGFGANYGGRLSSVMDVRLKEGNSKEFHVDAGVGILASRISIEGPILKDKLSFIVSGRRSYVDHLFRLAGSLLPFYFYDMNAKINYRISERDKLFLSAYVGNDVLSLVNPTDSSKKDANYTIDFGSTLGNITGTLRWNHVYSNPKWFSNLSLIHSRFSYQINGDIAGNKMQINSKIEDVIMKMDMDHYRNNHHHIKTGFEITSHHFRPNISKVEGSFSDDIQSSEGRDIYTQELAVYALSDQSFGARCGMNYGIRISSANTEHKFYIAPEPRLTLRYSINEKQNIKVSYSKMYQYMHLVSGSSATMPTDLWYPVSSRIKPQSADQISLAYNRDLPLLKSVFTADVYYKWMHNLVEYREGTVVMLNDQIEDDLLQGKGWAYGMELMLQKSSGRFTGWIGYSLSWSMRQFDELNKGKEFFSRYDRRHDLSIVTSYEATKRVAFSAVWVYATGSRFTPVIGQFLMPNGNYTNVDALPIYSDRNAVQLGASHRLDVNMIIRSKLRKKWNSEWHIGAYNVYNQTQPYRIKIVTGPNGAMHYKQTGLFGFIPSVAFNIKF